MTKTPNPATHITFPIRALELAEQATKDVESDLQTLEDAVIGEFLPRTIRVILGQDEACREILRSNKGIAPDVLAERISQVFWSHPGSMGGLKTERYLMEIGLSHADADTLATNLYRYSRYVISLVNSVRMTRSACNLILEMIEPDRFRSRSLKAPALPPHAYTTWLQRCEDFGSKKFDSPFDVSIWLVLLEEFIIEVSSTNSWARRKSIDDRTSAPPEIERSAASMAKSTSRLFGQYLYVEYSLNDLPQRYASREGSFKKQIKEMATFFSSSDSAIYSRLFEDFESRRSRIKASSRMVKNHQSKPRQSFIENYMSNVASIDNRKVTIKNNSENISPQLINQMYRLFMAQMAISDAKSKFVGQTSHEKESLIVEIERPQMSDAKKLRKLLEVMFSRD